VAAVADGIGTIGNVLNLLLGLWLAYSAMVANPAGDLNVAGLAASAVAVLACAVWARRTDPMDWPSGTDLVLGAVHLVVAMTRWAVYVPPLLSFWILLLVGIAISVAAMWSMLYRPDTLQSRARADLARARLRRQTCRG
jgi:chromate transport protein ChrA